jgi:hypothetical protein
MNWVKVLAQDELPQDARKVVKVDIAVPNLMKHSKSLAE